MIICEQIIGNLDSHTFEGCQTDLVEIEWHEAYKRIHRKKTQQGREIGIRLGTEILTRGLREGDVLYQDGNQVIAVTVLPCDAILITVDPHHPQSAMKVCYEIGNQHAPLLWGEGSSQLVTPYNEPLFKHLSKLHGIQLERAAIKLDFDRSISSTVSSHSH